MPSAAAQPLRDQIEQVTTAHEQFWGQYDEAKYFSEIRRRRALRLGMQYPRRVDFSLVAELGEGQDLEFMVQFPDSVHELAKEIAAFATTNPGTIFLGVADDGEIVGVDGLSTMKGRDKLRQRIEGTSSRSISPSIAVNVEFEAHSRKRVVRIEVPKGPEPVYYTSDRPYIRHISMSRPATQTEVVELVRRWNARHSGKEKPPRQRRLPGSGERI
jgi:predicted HTH transcriptional regulator